MDYIQRTRLIIRIDKLIRERQTGQPQDLAKQLGIGLRSLYRIVALMKDLGAPIRYSEAIGSYIYESEVYFDFGFKKIKKAAS